MAIEVVEKQVYDWHELPENRRALIRSTIKAEAAQLLRSLPKMVAAKVAVEIVAESLGTTPPRLAMSAVGGLCSDLAVETLKALDKRAIGGES